MSLTCTWKQLALDGLPAHLAARSSHNLAVLHQQAYIFGGELKPRTPIGNELVVVDLHGGPVRVLEPKPSQPWPSARVGAAMTSHPASNSLYLWGGRGGKDMSAIAVRTSNEDELDDVWKFDIQSEEWSKLSTLAKTESDFPQARSFHTMTADADSLYVHAGCPAKGRLAELNVLALSSGKWSSLASAPEPARGGTVITAVLPPKKGSPNVLIRWGGFCGYELGGPLDIFDTVTGKWESHPTTIEGSSEEPAKRSVHGLVAFPGPKSVETGSGRKDVVAIMFLGEGTGAPAELGHDGAGKFLNDVYALLRDNDSYSWLALEAQGPPEPRGWFAFAGAASKEGGVDIVVHGGLHESNERLKDAWILHVE